MSCVQSMRSEWRRLCDPTGRAPVGGEGLCFWPARSCSAWAGRSPRATPRHFACPLLLHAALPSSPPFALSTSGCCPACSRPERERSEAVRGRAPVPGAATGEMRAVSGEGPSLGRPPWGRGAVAVWATVASGSQGPGQWDAARVEDEQQSRRFAARVSKGSGCHPTCRQG